MRFGVIVCPKCKQGKGIILSSKTTKCIRCGKTLQISTLKILYKTDSEEILRQIIGRLNAEMAGNLETYKKMVCNH